MPRSVKPMQSDIFDPNWGKCAYCYCVADAPLYIIKDNIQEPQWPRVVTRYIYNCQTHSANAYRDFRAYLHFTSRVLQADALTDKLFANTVPIVVERAHRTYFDKVGWTISNSNDAYVQKDSTGTWTVSVVNTEKNLTKRIPVSDLKLSIFDHTLVDAFISRLDEGFYKAEYEASVSSE